LYGECCWILRKPKLRKAYFNALAEDAVFIGTDSFEVWNKKQFLDFAAPYFKKGKAWDFVKISRNLHFDGERRMIWFDEVLDTWMGPCRGSGWIAIEGDQLKIKQYVLSMTVPNDKIDGCFRPLGLCDEKGLVASCLGLTSSCVPQFFEPQRAYFFQHLL
jgi:hypothetical protein